jgi:hypothetical protein
MAALEEDEGALDAGPVVTVEKLGPALTMDTETA